MAETVLNSTVRIFDIISAIKDYSYMDQAPIQEIDLAQALDTTLTMVNSRLEHVTIERLYDPKLPRISAYGELQPGLDGADRKCPGSHERHA